MILNTENRMESSCNPLRLLYNKIKRRQVKGETWLKEYLQYASILWNHTMTSTKWGDNR
jgi:hypothetical protein